MATNEPSEELVIRLPLESEADIKALRSALLAARASELAEIRRRSGRLSYGYGSDSAREGMNAEVEARERRHRMVDLLIDALPDSEPGP